MKLIRQVLNDFRRELVWIIVYSVLASTVFCTLPGLFGALSSESRRQLYEIEEELRRSDLSMIVTKGLRIGSVPEDARVAFDAPPRPYTGRTLRAMLEEGFSREGKLGSFAVERDADTGRAKYVFFVGKYVDLAPVAVPEDCDYYICASEGAAESAGGTVTVFGEELPITGVVPEGTAIYHPVRPYAAENLDGALYVFIRDYESLRRIFWYSHTTFINENLIAVGADREELAELVSAMHRETGQYVCVQTTEELLGVSTERMKTYAELLFKLSAVFALLAAMALNISRAIRRWGTEYSIHHLFGAPGPFIFARMLLFGLGYNLIAVESMWYRVLFPVGWTFTYFADGTVAAEKTRGAVSAAEAGRTAVSTGVIAAAVLAVCVYEFIRFKAKFSKGMRGE